MQHFLAGRKHKVLIVDDEPLISESLSLIFRQAGFEPRVAYSAELALNLLTCANVPHAVNPRGGPGDSAWRPGHTGLSANSS
jgi:hypothetical protein